MEVGELKTQSVRMRREAKRTLFLICVYLLVALGIRFVYLIEFSESPLFSTPLGPDVEEYASWANEILSGNLLWQSVRIHSPLYPYFLATFLWLFDGDNAICGVRVTQMILGFLAVIPVAGALRLSLMGASNVKNEGEVGGGVRFPILLIFLLLWAWYPPLIYYLGELTSEVLLVPLLSLSVYCLYVWDARVSARLVETADDDESDSVDLDDADEIAKLELKRSRVHSPCFSVSSSFFTICFDYSSEKIFHPAKFAVARSLRFCSRSLSLSPCFRSPITM